MWVLTDVCRFYELRLQAVTANIAKKIEPFNRIFNVETFLLNINQIEIVFSIFLIKG